MAGKPARVSPIAADNLTADEQAFFDSGGEKGGTTPNPKADAAESDGDKGNVSRETTSLVDGDAGTNDTTTQTVAEPKTVPLAALQESRETNKELKARLTQEAARFAALEERTNKLFERIPTAAPVPQQGTQTEQIDPSKDPLGYMLSIMDQQGKELEQLKQGNQQRQDQDRTGQQLAKLQSDAVALEQEFVTETPDYVEASQFLQSSRLKELSQLGYTPSERQTIVRQEALGIAARAMQQGKNPAALIYEMAGLRGYAKKDAAGNGNTGVQPVSADLAANADKLKALDKGQRENVSLTNTGGNAPRPMTAQRLIEMSPAEFDAFAEKHPKDFRQIMGN